MNTKFFISCIVLAIFIAINSVISAETEPNVEDYLVVLLNSADITKKLHKAEEEWNQLSQDFAQLLSKSTQMYHEITNLVPRQSTLTPDAKRISEKLKEDIRWSFVRKNIQLLASAVSEKNYSSIGDIEKCCAHLFWNHNTRLYTTIIDEIDEYTTPEVLSLYLEQSYRNEAINKFESLVKTQVYMYWKYKNTKKLNDVYLMNVAYLFYKMQHEALYAQIDEDTKCGLEKAIETLPSTLQYFYFRPTFCLINKAQPEYLYVAADDLFFNDNVRKVFTWHEPNYTDNIGYFSMNVTESKDNKNNLVLKYTFKNIYYGKYLYLERAVEKENNILAAWNPGNVPTASDWSVQLVDNAVVLSQNGLVMCIDEIRYHDEDRRFVHGHNDQQHTATTASCQWIAVKCE